MARAASNPLKVVDVSSLDQSTADDVLQGFSEQGFLFVDGHDFTQDEVDQLFKLSAEFFDIPLEKKQKVAIDKQDCGYTSFNQESLDPNSNKNGDPKEAFNFGSFNFLTGDCNKDQLPNIFQSNDNYKFIQSIIKKQYKLATRILELLAIGLQIDEQDGGKDWFTKRHPPIGKSTSAMRMLHYPPLSKLDAETAIRAGAHTDYGSITLLLQQQNQEGLEIHTSKENGWEPVPFIPSPNENYIKLGKAAPIIVNIADQLSFWTSGVLKSTLHRVKLPINGNDRYSIAFFFDAESSTRLTPIPSPLIPNSNNPSNFQNENDYMTSGEYMQKKFAGTFISGHS
ncbi:1-aminocyclopropane-1-carboxylate oxidase 3 [Wickerhamomyces ciferrii]|uniref:1-aminocyclopropane-1-carboxylate oxidase 3 n=1 Tax=Wickerhamomyces ciferrii (strain ATCC 14091 / BCRC 22168 / CBS 111 / JCM 3599 / NBRC 0793 / NRRL Y-1031 F-60-10) TaxID=1206466 RepID=K0KKK6_WICCF|nr:1-aminocyclopropane-1-carboxylate oxidase 3 [Wickerhamomyces ciferrii]CCH43516.1 1-aminocyclopropane-1-carboxylate oxidase 3 [Wickerhamomyces ciferrii]